MKIKSNASQDELSSPFFSMNKKFCSEFESYIANKNGKVKGNYNAWSYLIFGKFSKLKNWDLIYKKSTFTSSGNLLLSSKFQSLFVMAKWIKELNGTHNSEFEIRKKTLADFIRIPLSKSLSKLEFSNKYVIIRKGNETQFLSQLIETLKSLFISGEIYKIDHSNKKLEIELRTEKHHFEVLDKLIELQN